MKTERTIIVGAVCLMLLSCGRRQTATTDKREWEEVKVETTAPATAQPAQEGAHATNTEVKTQEEVKHTTTRGGSSSYSYDQEDDDNMRGFDPASEDDMPDTGMSRYMENNDDEGWD